MTASRIFLRARTGCLQGVYGGGDARFYNERIRGTRNNTVLSTAVTTLYQVLGLGGGPLWRVCPDDGNVPGYHHTGFDVLLICHSD